MNETIGGTLYVLSLLGCIALAWWLVFTYVEPGPRRPQKPVVVRPDYAPVESIDSHLLRGISTILILEILFGGHRDH